jgi:hypothetical protein
MKNLLTIATVMVFALSVGLAYADEIPTTFSTGKDIGLTMSDDAVVHEMNVAKGAAAGGLGAEKAAKSDVDIRAYLGPGGSNLP